jgi:hypothetical protein
VLDVSGPLNGHAVPQWLGHLASLEQAAAELWAFEATTIHGLLQTPAYAEAVEQTDATPKSDTALAQRVRIRVTRQAVLTRQPEPLQLSVILDESVLRRRAGTTDVMAGQLDHLLVAAAYPNVDLQVLPLDAGVFVFGSFTLVANEQSADPFMAITEDRAGAHYLDRLGEVDAHVALFSHLVDKALTPDESLTLIRSVKETHA